MGYCHVNPRKIVTSQNHKITKSQNTAQHGSTRELHGTAAWATRHAKRLANAGHAYEAHVRYTYSRARSKLARRSRRWARGARHARPPSTSQACERAGPQHVFRTAELVEEAEPHPWCAASNFSSFSLRSRASRSTDTRERAGETSTRCERVGGWGGCRAADRCSRWAGSGAPPRSTHRRRRARASKTRRDVSGERALFELTHGRCTHLFLGRLSPK